MVGISLGGIRKTGRRTGKKRPRTSGGKKPYISTASRQTTLFRAPGYGPGPMPAQKTVTFRYTQSVSHAVDPTTYYKMNYNDVLIPGLNTLLSFDADFAGGWLTHFHFYDKSQTLACKMKSTVLNAGLTDVNGLSIAGSHGQGYVLAACVSYDSAKSLAVIDTVDGQMKHLRTIQGSEFKMLGSSNGGHDVATVHTSCDLQRFIGQQPDLQHSVRRVNNSIYLPEVASQQLGGAPVLCTFWGNQFQTPRPTGSNLKIVFEIELEYTVLFSSLRTLDRTLADVNRALSVVSPS